MSMAVDAIFENGVLKPLNPLGLAEQQKVHLIVETNTAAPAKAQPRWHWQEAQAIQDGFAGAVADEAGWQRREERPATKTNTPTRHSVRLTLCTVSRITTSSPGHSASANCCKARITRS